MTTIGYSLSTEEHRPEDLVRFARRAEEVGFEYAAISDHFHPWLEAQGNSGFVWSILGAIAQATERIQVGTSVTCPTFRYHPAIVAQAAATVASLMPGRFFLGVGTGEALNEHITGDRFPPYDLRAERLEEAVGIIRALWTGDEITHRGKHFTAEKARLYTLPDELPPLHVAASGPKSTALAARVGDGLINYSADPSVADGFRRAAGDTKPRYVQLNVCWDEEEAEARRTALEICGNVALKGDLGQVLSYPAEYEQAVQMLTEDDVAEIITCGPDAEKHLGAIRASFDAGYDHVHVYQVGADQEGFFRFYERDILPQLR